MRPPRAVQKLMCTEAEHRSLTSEGLRAGDRAAARVCRIAGVDEADVPVGRELWCDESFARDVLGERAP